MRVDSVSDLPSGAREQAVQKLAEQSRRDLIKKAQREHGTVLDFKGAGKQETKYHNEPTEARGLRFDSKKEARRFEQLLELKWAGEIRDLRLQRDFTLVEAYTTPEGLRVRAIRYRADFAYERPTAPDVTGAVYWIKVVEDVKSRGTRTKDYIMKRKLMQEKYGITIEEV